MGGTGSGVKTRSQKVLTFDPELNGRDTSRVARVCCSSSLCSTKAENIQVILVVAEGFVACHGERSVAFEVRSSRTEGRARQRNLRAREDGKDELRV